MNRDQLEALVKEVIDEMSGTGVGASFTAGGDFTATPNTFYKRKNKGTPKDWKQSKIQNEDAPILAGGKIKHNYAVEKFGFTNAPSIPNRASKAIEYKELWQESYAHFRNETKTRTKPEQFHQAVKAVKKKVHEINKLMEYVDRLKCELNENNSLKYKKHTENAIAQIKEHVAQLHNKVKKFK
jgi:hypothetical protein